jgi:hypothetical protein
MRLKKAARKQLPRFHLPQFLTKKYPSHQFTRNYQTHESAQKNVFTLTTKTQPHTAQPNRLNSAAQTKSKKWTSTNQNDKLNEIFTSQPHHERMTRTVARNGEFEGQSPSSQDDSAEKIYHSLPTYILSI